MTKENSTKPAFVSMESGRGDGFLNATHVGIIHTPTVSCCHCFNQWNTTARWTEHTGSHDQEKWNTEINCVVNDVQYSCTSCSVHSSSSWNESTLLHIVITHTLSVRTHRNSFHQSIANDWPQHVHSLVSDLTLFANLWPEDMIMRPVSSLSFVTTCFSRELFGCDLFPQPDHTKEEQNEGKAFPAF